MQAQETRLPTAGGRDAHGHRGGERFLRRYVRYERAVSLRMIVAHAVALAGIPLWLSGTAAPFQRYEGLADGVFAVALGVLAAAVGFELWCRSAMVRAVRATESAPSRSR